MTQSKAQHILQLCDAWRAAYVQPDGSGVSNASTEKLRLIANGIRFHELEFDELEAACVGLTETMVSRGLGGFICADHHHFWRWCAQLLLTTPMSSFVPTSGNLIHQLLESSACLLMGGSSYFWAEPEIQFSKDYDLCLKRLIGKKLFILEYLSYPLLDLLLKAHCNSFVSDDGKVTQSFEVTRADGSKRTYEPGKAPKPKYCSSVGDLLYLLEKEVAGPELKASLHRLKNHFHQLDQNTAFFDLLFKWRNTTLHGEDQVTGISCTVFNMCLLLCLEFVRPNYATLRQAAVSKVIERKAATHNISPIYYHDV